MNEIFAENEKKAKSGIRFVREEIFKLVFSVELVKPSDDNLREALELYLNVNDEAIAKWRKEDLTFFTSYLEGIADNYDYLKKSIVDVVDNWDFERISVVERALLRIAVYELLIEKKPIEIVANEAVELAKEYGEEKSYEFVNGVLAKVESTK